MSATLAATKSAALVRFTTSASRLSAAAGVPDEILEVKTGLLGLGKHLYVPMSAVQEVLPESVFLSRPKEEFESLGYYEKPAQLS